MSAELRRGGQVVEDEVAVGDRVEGVRGDAVEAELGSHGVAVELVVETDRGARRRAAARGRPRALAAKRLAVAVEHPERRPAGAARARSPGRAAGACRRAARVSTCSLARPTSTLLQRAPAPRPAARSRGAGAGARRSRPGRCGCGRCAAWRRPRPPVSVSRRSIAMWTSSSASSGTKAPDSISAADARRAPLRWPPLSPPSARRRLPARRACATLPSMSSRHRRQSSDSDELSAHERGVALAGEAARARDAHVTPVLSSLRLRVQAHPRLTARA